MADGPKAKVLPFRQPDTDRLNAELDQAIVEADYWRETADQIEDELWTERWEWISDEDDQD